uniref:Sorbin and SH3 domain-containing protein n=1 Tax=Anopheles stephensi TaxID=30069 RepID=A0A182XZB0_ANOST
MQQSAPKVEGIGPISREGMPLTLRSEIDEGNRDKWYKQMYQTLHKTHDDGYPYKSTGYQSEPEANYDSDYTIKYSTLDRRRTPVGLSPTSYNKFSTLQSAPTTPQPYHHQQSVKSGHSAYKNQPGRIEDYTPGRSSISEKESKEQLEHQKLTTSKTYTEGNLSRALKEQGYESDSTLVFRKREPTASAALSPVEQKQHYKTMQAGGEIPLQGFRKPAPERPKDRNEEAIESDLVVEIKENNCDSNSNIAYAGDSNTIACYPITNIHRPLDMFGSFPKESRTFVPPVPPSRKSSRSNSTLKIMAQVKTNTFNRRTMLERTTTTTTSAANPHKFRSKSAGPLLFGGGATSSSSIMSMSASMMKEEKNQENNTRVASKRSTVAAYRAGSSSPTGQARKPSQSPVAFGRGISKERTFAEEKKRIEEKLPKIVSVSTSILRNPELKSPNEVKKALRSSYLPIVGKVETAEGSSLKRFSSSGTYRSASSIYSSDKSLNRVLSPASNHKKEEKSFKVSIATAPSSKGKDTSLQKRSLNRKSNTGRAPTITIKTSFQKASKAFGLKTTSSSNQSLARSCSTYSIDSTASKSRRSRISYAPSASNTLATTRNYRQTPQRVVVGSSFDRGIKSLKTKSPTVGTQQSAYSQSIVQQKENLRSDAFFQKLFLQTSSPNFDTDEKPPTSVLEKAHHWNKLTCRSEPSLKQSNYYLTQAKPVSSSKFKTKDKHDSAKVATEYQTVRQVGPDVIEQVHRFESMMKLTEDQPEDQQNQFGYVRGRRMEIDFSFHERSRSEPPAQTMTTTTTTTTSTTIQEELIGTDSPRTIVGRRCQIAQRTSRSPSCRRIQYLKGKEGQVKKIIRARSLSGNAGQRERGAKSKDELVRSHSLNLSQGPLVSRSRFRDLNNFYNSLERLGQLERVTSSSSNDLRPSRRTREEEIIDYDLWKRVRDQEKAERELNQLKSKLKQDQREKDLFFLPRDPEDVRWRSDQDTGLRNREKSVEDLKCILNEQALNFEDAKLRDLENRKDYYKPLWRGSSVIDVASHLEEKYSTTGEKRDEPQSLDVISSNLLSTLSFEQMKKLKNQLSEIYSTGTQKDPTTVSRATAQVHQQEEYVINVPERASRLETLLKVRSHSVLTQDKINESHLRTQVTAFGKKSSDKSDRVLPKKFESNSLPSKAVDREALSRTLCQELKDKILEKHHTLPSIGKKKKHARPTILTTETSHFLSLDSNLKKASDTKPAPQPSRDVARKEREKEFEVIVRNEPSKSYCDTESISSETSNKTVIFRSQSMAQAVDVPPVEDIKTKIKYFEEKQAIDETPTVTIYHAREDSSLSENESGPQRDDEHGKTIAAKGTCSSMITLSQSFTDLKDLFGEKRSVSCSTYTASTSQDSKRSSARKLSPKRFTLRSRSTTPDYATCIQTGEVKKIKDKFESLDVNIWRQSAAASASPERQYQSDSELGRHPSGEDEKKANDGTGKRQCKAATGSTIVRHHESGDVSRITHKYEAQSERARTRKSRKERVISPIPKNPFRKDDRFMPHINVISKTASLKREMKPTRTSNTQHQPAAAAKQQPAAVLQSAQLPNVSAGSNRRSASSGSEEFEKLKSKFESGEQLSLLGKMYTSVPDIRELKDISGYLSGAWIAHQFPRPTDNARSLAAPDQSPPGRQIVRKGSAPSPDRFHRHHSFRFHTHQPETLRMHSSPSPRQSSDSKTRHKRNGSDGVDGFLKQFYTPDGGDTPYHDQKDSWEKSRSRRRLEVEALWRKIQAMTGNTPTAGTDVPVDKPSVTFEESPRRYIESDVNIHYKTPIRFEYKEPIPDDELAHRQAEHMRRVYQEERRRKYMHELEDLHSRRHMDNILPSQKSPIPLNRYDDFAADLSPKPQIVQQPKTIARALYNFQGQSIRELSFRKGDIIYLRRQIDKNWYEGEHNATVGLLPANYIEIISRDNFNVRPLPKKPSREGKARAKFNFTAQTAVELSLLKGELVTLTRRVDDNWFEGKIGSKKGIFPVSYVEILTDIDGEESYDIEPIVSRPQSALGVTSQSSHALTTHYDNSHTNGRISPGVVRETKTIQKTEVLHVDTSNEPISYRALYNYKPQNTDELELLEGDVVYVLEKCDDGWYVGTSARTGCFGTFPGNYVSKM